MKKTAAVLLCGAMLLGMAACGEKKPGGETLTGTARGYGGDVTVTLTKENGVIAACSIKGDNETPEVGGKALAELEQQVVKANGYEINGVSGATITSTAVRTAVAAALGETDTEPTPSPAETVPATGKVEGEGGLQLGLAYTAAHGTKCFTEAYAAVQGDVIVAAYLDDFQFVDADAGLDVVPSSDKEFGEGYAEGKALASKRTIADYYSRLMEEKAGSTVRIDDNFDAIQAFAVGKTIAQVESAAAGGNVVDAVSGATLADTAGYLRAIAQAAKNAQSNQAAEFSGSAEGLKLSVAYGAANGENCFTTAAALTGGDKILLCYVDEFQFLDAAAGVEGVPNSDSDLAAGYAEGKVLCSKRTVADYYSGMMADYAGSTVRIDDNFDAIQAHVSGMTVAEAETLSQREDAVDVVSGATLANTARYVETIVKAARQ